MHMDDFDFDFTHVENCIALQSEKKRNRQNRTERFDRIIAWKSLSSAPCAHEIAYFLFY